jgi:hypothetical protein
MVDDDLVLLHITDVVEGVRQYDCKPEAVNWPFKTPINQFQKPVFVSNSRKPTLRLLRNIDEQKK